jgi:hypothetical protein
MVSITGMTKFTVRVLIVIFSVNEKSLSKQKCWFTLDMQLVSIYDIFLMKTEIELFPKQLSFGILIGPGIDLMYIKERNN